MPWLRNVLSRLGPRTARDGPDAGATPDLVALIPGEAPYLRGLDATERARLNALAYTLLGKVTMSAAAGLELTDAMRATIAVQASLPVLGLGLAAYTRFSEIIVYPSEFLVPREVVDEAGVLHAGLEALEGESWDGGPVILSWQAIADGADAFGKNVVIHEFVHKLDMGNGAVDGVPRLYRTLHGALTEARFCAILEAALDHFAAELDDLEDHFPRHLDPESPAGQRHYARLPLDAYAATDAAEFFSVAAETFFVAPERLQGSMPDLYDLLRAYFLQDPAARQRAAGASAARV